MHKHKIWHNDNDGEWYTHIYDEKGKRRIRHRKTEKQLEDYLVDFYKKKEDKVFIKDVFCQCYDKKLANGEIQKQSYDRYKSDFERFFKKGLPICEKQFKQITEKDIEDLIRNSIRDHNLTRKTYNGLAILINGIFRYGKEQHLTELSITSVMGDINLSDRIFAKKPVNVAEKIFREDERPIVVDYIRNNPSIWNMAVLLMFQTGLRVGELAALKFTDIEDDGTNVGVHVKRTEVKYNDADGHSRVKIQEHPKTSAGDRCVYLSDRGVETINIIRQLNPNGTYLFENKKGVRLRGTTITQHLYRLCEKLGLHKRSSHKVRSTYGTMLLDSGLVDDSTVAEMMGHRSVQTTRQLYYFSDKSRKTKAAQVKQAIAI